VRRGASVLASWHSARCGQRRRRCGDARRGRRGSRADRAKADVNAPQNDGATALHWAVFKGNREMARR
jgi:hypothetical protein